jgi:hypothetical protein
VSRTRRNILTWCFPLIAGALGLTLRLSGYDVGSEYTADGVPIAVQDGFKGVDVPPVTYRLTPLTSWVDASPYQPH